ncbi:CGNR zinc finger domain-containing protein [Kitasatospora sp. NPDC101157]|uniref:CGNR zinc finger domain-containing protein n=1 Tax=Kitasatospora sp. NPDC101157 TaxID=3364098 RepID=UPI0037FBC870
MSACGDRFGICRTPLRGAGGFGCNRFYIDTGRRTPQRFCTPRCAVRVRVAAHRAHRAAG